MKFLYYHSTVIPFHDKANQNSPIWVKLGMNHDLSPPWTWLNIAKAIKAGLLALLPPPHTTEGKRAYLMVNNGLTFQEQSWVPDAGEGTQLVLIPATRVDNQEVTTIIEEHKLFINRCIIVLMFTYESQLQYTWDVCFSAEPTTCNVNSGVCDALAVPTTDLSECDINQCIGEYVTKWQCQVSYRTFKELSQKGELFKDILQRIILPARFKAATASKCEVIHMWIKGLRKAPAFAKLDGQPKPRLKIEHSLAYPGMTAGVCCMAISSGPITAPFPFPCPLFEEGDK